MSNLFKLAFGFKNCDWKEKTTQSGNKKFYRLWANVWLSVVVLPNNKLWILYGKDKIKNNLLWDNGRKEKILKQVEELLSAPEEENKAWEDMKQHEKIAEIGKREIMKANKEVKKDCNVFGDGFYIIN